jgi:hypothetical protein
MRAVVNHFVHLAWLVALALATVSCANDYNPRRVVQQLEHDRHTEHCADFAHKNITHGSCE